MSTETYAVHRTGNAAALKGKIETYEKAEELAKRYAKDYEELEIIKSVVVAIVKSPVPEAIVTKL